jgi:two-component system OmpR family sensor kinase
VRARLPSILGLASGRLGLGLCVAKDIIEQQGGSIEASSAPGVGTVFTVRLPALESPSGSSPA